MAVVLPTAFRVASRLRRARAFHPRGLVFEARWHPAPSTGALPGSPLTAGPRDAFARISHGIGLPASAPDILGLAVKLLDVHGAGRDQDLLLASTGAGALGRHLLRPGRSLSDVVLSTLLPYEVAGVGRRAIVAVPVGGEVPVSYADVRNGAPPPTFELRIGGVDGTALGQIRPGARVPADVGEAMRFDPWHTGPELEPVGWLNRIRRPTYQASQDGRRAPQDGWREATRASNT